VATVNAKSQAKLITIKVQLVMWALNATTVSTLTKPAKKALNALHRLECTAHPENALNLPQVAVRVQSVTTAFTHKKLAKIALSARHQKESSEHLVDVFGSDRHLAK
jgi:hypothetical protein